MSTKMIQVICLSSFILFSCSHAKKSNSTSNYLVENLIFKTVINHFINEIEPKWVVVDPRAYIWSPDLITTDKKWRFNELNLTPAELKRRHDEIKMMDLTPIDINLYEKCPFPGEVLPSNSKRESIVNNLSEKCKSLINRYALQVSTSQVQKDNNNKRRIFALLHTNHSTSVYELILEKEKKWEVIQKNIISFISS